MAGRIGSGKTEVCRELHARTGWEVISAGVILRRLASERGVSVLEMNEYANSHPDIDRAIDERIAALSVGDHSVIVDSRLAWHFIPASFKVYLVVEPATAAQRVFLAGRPDEKYTAVETTLADNEERQRLERERYRQLYGLDCEDWRNYNLIVDTTHATPGEVADRILKDALAAPGAGAGPPACWLSPRRVLPTRSAGELGVSGVAAPPGPARPEDSPVEIAVRGGSYLILHGHARVSAALRGQEPLVACRLAASGPPAPQAGGVTPDCSTASTSWSWIREWEDAHAFKFASYPAWLAPGAR